MAVSKGPVKIKCPSCNSMLSVSAPRGQSTLNCPYCKTRIKITQGSSGMAGAAPPPVIDDDIDRFEHDITFFDKLPIIQNIIWKDILSMKKLFIILFIIGIIATVATALGASTAEQQALNELEDLNSMTPEDRRLEEERLKNEELSDIGSLYVSLIISSVIIIFFISNQIYGMEVKRGTMRSLCLYSIDMNGLTVAKTLSIILIYGLIQLFIFVMPLYPYMRTTPYSWMSSVVSMAFILNVFVIITAAFGSNLITYITGKLYIGMHRLIAIFIILYLFFTQTMFEVLGQLAIEMRNAEGESADEMFSSFSALGQDLGQISPYHGGGRLVTNAAGHNTGGPDIFLVILIGLGLIICGYILGKKIYLDVFIRE